MTLSLANTRAFEADTGCLTPLSDWTAIGEVLGLDESSMTLAKSRVSAVTNSGAQKVVRMTTRLGRGITCTPDAVLFLTIDGWRSASSLRRGQCIATPAQIPIFGRNSPPEMNTVLLAYCCAFRGLATSGRMFLTTDNPQLKQQVIDLALHFGFKLSREARGKGKEQFSVCVGQEHEEDLRMMTLAPPGEEQRVPDVVFSLDRKSLIIFLRTLFSISGSVYVRAGKTPGASFCTRSRAFAEGLQHLLLRFGLTFSLRLREDDYRGEYYPSHEVRIDGKASVLQFLSVIDPIIGQPLRSQISACRNASRAAPRRDIVPTGDRFWREVESASGGRSVSAVCREAGVRRPSGRKNGPLTRQSVQRLAAKLSSPWLTALAKGDVYWDEIESIIDHGEEEVGALLAAKHYCFVANDIIVHNSEA